MTAYTVHEQMRAGPNRLERADAVAFVKEGFAWLALAFPILWLIFHRMWLELVGFVVVLIGLDLGLAGLGVNPVYRGWIGFATVLIFALEANALRRWRLERAGYRMVASVFGRNRDEAELKFFEHWLDHDEARPEPAARGRPPLLPAVFPPPGGRADDTDDVIGVFPRG